MPATEIATQFAGRRGRLFWLSLKTSVLTVLTLGVYRFWMKTRLRRYYWSAVRPGGMPLEYTGQPLEKLLGFLIAVVFLAFYIGIVNLILMFLSFSLLQGNFAAYVLSFIGVIPLLFYAQYRARRYVLARTRWRGLRFGLDPGAWGYAWRALLHWLATILTAGLLWPRMTFWLEKYRTDRTSFGTVKLRQGGRWTMLFRPMLPLVTGLVVTVLSGLAIAGNEPVAVWGLVAGVPLIFFGWVNYRVQGFRLLTDHKTAGDIGFRATPRPWRVLRIYLVGSLLIVLVLVALLIAVTFGLGLVFSVAPGGTDAVADLAELATNLPTWATAGIAILIYFTVFVFWGVLTHTFLTLPLTRHYAETLQIIGAPRIAAIGQRAQDAFSEAEGLAEALDVGAAI